jgi:hypothetical protein
LNATLPIYQVAFVKALPNQPINFREIGEEAGCEYAGRHDVSASGKLFAIELFADKIPACP